MGRGEQGRDQEFRDSEQRHNKVMNRERHDMADVFQRMVLAALLTIDCLGSVIHSLDPQTNVLSVPIT